MENQNMQEENERIKLLPHWFLEIVEEAKHQTKIAQAFLCLSIVANIILAAIILFK